MNKIKFAMKNIAVLAILISSFIACDKDFVSVGSDIIGQNNFITDQQKYEVMAYTHKLDPVQTNNLPLNYLGTYVHPTYGLTTASFVSQVNSSLLDPDFGDDVVLDSVILTVPYFSTRIEVNSEGTTIYELDSVFGNGNFDLSIYENTYFLSDFDPNSEFDVPLRYYSNATTSNNSINSTLLEGTPILFESDVLPLTNVLTNFAPSNSEIELWDEEDEVTGRLSPSLRLKLDKEFWQEKILDKEGEPELSNTNNFQNYFRGIYFKATPTATGNGSMTLLNFGASNANITLYYSKAPLTDGDDRVESTYVLTFSGNRINFLQNNFTLNIPEGNAVSGDEKLYLKGMEGAIAVVDIFNSGTIEDGYSPEFNAFKEAYVETDSDGKFVKSKRLVNEANLVFYVDQSLVIGDEPNRVFIYDLKNGVPLFDYFVDAQNSNDPENSRTNHLGALQREGDVSSGAGIKYKIKITEHINNLLLRDSTNVKLGLAVSGNVNLENATPQYDLLTSEDAIVNKIPVSSILSPKGTVLYGNNTSNEQKKLYLEIYYTEPNN